MSFQSKLSKTNRLDSFSVFSEAMKLQNAYEIKKNIEIYQPDETEQKIMSFLDEEGVSMKSPCEKYYDYLERKRNINQSLEESLSISSEIKRFVPSSKLYFQRIKKNGEAHSQTP